MSAKKTDKRLLIVDDEPSITMSVSAALRKQYRVVDTANDAHEAIRKVKANQYDLVLTDYRMPGMSGIDLGEEIMRLSPQTRVMFMTAHQLDAGLKKAANQMSGMLQKPFTLAQIRELVADAVARVGQYEQIETPAEHQEILEDAVRALTNDTGARCSLLLHLSGSPMATAGATVELDLDSISTLVTANFVAASELARLLGNASTFRSSFHEGVDYDIYAYAVTNQFLLAVVFGTESKAGMVRLYTHRTAEDIQGILADYQPSIDLPDDVRTNISDGLDDLFS